MALYRRRKRAPGNFRRFLAANKKQIGILMLIVAVIVVAALTTRQMAAQKDLAASFLKTNDTIRIGIRVGVPGFGELDENGEIVGFDRDYIDVLLSRLVGSEPKIYEYVPLTGQDAGAAIKYGRTDISLGQLGPGMLQTTGFTLTNPYFTDRVVAVVPESSQIASIRELTGGIGLLQTAVPSSKASAELEELGIAAELVSYSDYESALTDLDYGRIGAVLMPYETTRQFSREDYRILTEELFTVDYCILLPSGQAALADEMNAVIAQMSENGTIANLRNKWNV